MLSSLWHNCNLVVPHSIVSWEKKWKGRSSRLWFTENLVIRKMPYLLELKTGSIAEIMAVIQALERENSYLAE